ncbi:MAG: dienelactone hydrolase family protein [Rhizomicrobium sp.]
MGMRTIGLALLLLLAAAPAQAMDAAVRETMTVDGRRADVLGSMCRAAPRRTGAPLLVLLHGSYGDGRRHDPAVAGGRRPRGHRPGGARCGCTTTPGASSWMAPASSVPPRRRSAQRYRTDRRRTYLFGHSGGAVFALHLAMLESHFFAATAVHAGTWRRPEDFRVLDYATRKIPLAIVIGDRDQFFPMASLRRTERTLVEAGFPLAVTVVPGMDHWYVPKVAPGINGTAWKFLSAKTLDADPAYTAYR